YIANWSSSPSASLNLNQRFHFAVQGYSEGRVHFRAGPPAFAIEGTVYQRMLPVDRALSPLNLYLFNPERMDEQIVEAIPPHWIRAIRLELEGFNVLLHRFKEFVDNTLDIPSATLELSTEGPAREVAGILHYGAGARSDPRSILVNLREEDGPSRLPHNSSLYEPLAYPIFFPEGTPGWPIPNWTLRQYVRQLLLTEPRFQQFTSLSNLYMVDQMCRIEDERLRFASRSLVAGHRARNGVAHEVDQINGDDREEDEASFNAALPSSFVGSRAHRAEHVADALALAKRYGRPFGMLTLTTNPEWEEIREALHPGQTATTVPQITIRVFRSRLSKVVALFKATFGDFTYIVQVTEFQRRGLPHAHIVFGTDPECPVEFLDKVVSAQIPGEDQPRLRALVRKFMRHSDNHLVLANGNPNIDSRCYKNGICSFGFPQPLSEHTTVDPITNRIIYKRTTEEECMIAQYPPLILLAWEGHAHIDFSLSLESFVYMFKYIHKGPDHVDFRFRDDNLDVEEAAESVVEDFIKARYLSATEAAWRIFGYDLTNKSPTVMRLGVHTPGDNRRQFRGSAAPGSNASSLIRYMLRPAAFQDMLYAEYGERTTPAKPTLAQINGLAPLPPGHYLEKREDGQVFQPRLIRLRSRNECVARIKAVRPGAGEVFYIRQILLHKAVSSWREIRTAPDVNGVNFTFSTFQEAATAMGLFEDVSEAQIALQEALETFQPPRQLRFLFAVMVIDGANALVLWDHFEEALIRDFLPAALQDPSEAERVIAQQAGRDAVARLFNDLGHNAADFGLVGGLERAAEVEEELLAFRFRLHELSTAAARSRLAFNPEQRTLYHALLQAVADDDAPKLHLIQGKAGRGKTFVIHAVVNFLRSTERVVAVSGATGLCASSFDRGSTVHRLFEIPVQEPGENTPLVSRITPGKRRAKFLEEAEVIVIDEIWALGRAVIEAVDAVMRLIMGLDQPFGGKPVFAIGDPRQTAPVVPGAGKTQILEHSLLSSVVFPLFQLHELQQPVRNAEDAPFADWVDFIGEDHACSNIDLKDYFQTTDSNEEACRFLFPPDVLEEPREAAKRAFLSPINVHVNAFNKDVLDRLPGDESTVRSFDSVKGDVDDGDVPLTAPEILNELNGSGTPAHDLRLKRGALCIIMRNLFPSKGLVRNCKVVVVAVRSRIVVVRKLGDAETFPLPRITFEFQPPGFPFLIVRKQIPLRLAYALTFHGCQGATLDRTVIDCRLPIFAHGQRYASVSRCRRREHTLALIGTQDVDVQQPHVVNNIVYQEFVDVA
ncbi:hypothetical protein CF319_g7769, partial [Tilletia indica]